VLANTAVATPTGPVLDPCESGIRTDAVYVVYTSLEETFAALRAAGNFARVLDIPVTLVHFRTVPYALPIDAPCGISPVETDAFVTRLQAEGLDVRVRVHLCRDRRQAIPLAFPRPSLIVVAGRGGWWPTESERWRRRLEAAGHLVIFAHKETSHA
jgi:hypothetical protein